MTTAREQYEQDMRFVPKNRMISFSDWDAGETPDSVHGRVKNILDQVTITTDTWLKNPPIDHEGGFEVTAEFWRRNPEGDHKYKTFENITPKQFNRLVRVMHELKFRGEWNIETNRSSVYYGERYDTASVMIEFNRKERR